MPPRWLSLVVVLFWLGTSGVFFYREYWPSLEPNAPPPFAIDLLDESRDPVPSRWKVLHNGRHVLTATTEVEHRAKENDFFLRARFGTPPPQPNEKPLPPEALQIEVMTSEYQVNGDGQLLALKVDLTVHARVAIDQGDHFRITAQVEGQVTGGQFRGTYEVKFPDHNIAKKGELPPTAVSSQGSVLMPLHPVTHIRGLQPGRTWRVPLVDPLSDALSAALPGGQRETIYLKAHVLPQSELMTVAPTKTYYHKEPEQEYLIIEYTGDEMSARTWVRRSDGLVLRQEMTTPGETWVMERE